MPLTIPLKTRAPLQVLSLGRSGVPRTTLERQMLRAVIGGVAICDPGKAVEKLEASKGDLIGATIKEADLAKLFDAIEAVWDDPSAAPELTKLDTTVARALDTRAAYVAAVRERAASNQAVLAAGLAWAAALDVAQLARTADLVNTEVQLSRIPTFEKKQVALEQQVTDLQAEFTQLKAEMTSLKKKSASAPGPA
ncbi:hypothetical protein [Tropicibacter naphthalenivorans]|uniref:Uncharacterized protein n=1 Tax=Tropicibacter naphthalenivorans TaxID=441103 RepID=A0A0N7M183_9RHOB|nr:hypothetical protein [Tropicibacter naphthalenivorans]CUH82545.1 hypothetical protein TRN7648_04087 [Tropicibacter naphthalenivorans]SMD09835.1 hypothetical protein SAMN04488093_12015 [Tropicibacter naphthalenivorans]